MPITTPTTAFASATSSRDGKNVIPTLKAESHFFTDDFSYTQQAAQAFGPQSSDVFRTTASMSINGTVYSICKGKVFIQPQTGVTGKVNLILQPFTQPVPGLGIKYIIYRGLNESDFVANNEVAARGTTDFIDYIRDEFDNYFANDPAGNPAPAFLAKFIGFPDSPTAQDENKLIDAYFHKVATSSGSEEPEFAFEAPVIPRGIKLGTLTGDLGIDIILNEGDFSTASSINPFRLTLGFARASVGNIDLTTESDAFKQKLLREASTQFIDLAAFYGLHANDTSKLFTGTSTTPLTAKADVYAKMSGFQTKNQAYLYVQSNRQRSYDFYENYALSETDNNNLRIGQDEASMTNTEFGNQGWPVHIIDLAQQAVGGEAALSLALLTDKNTDAALYVQTGLCTSAHNRNFIKGESLLPALPEDSEAPEIQFTKPVSFALSADGADGISSLIQVVFEGQQLEAQVYSSDPNAETSTVQFKDIDDLFGPVDALSAATPGEDTQLPITVVNTLQLIHFPTPNSFDTGVVQVAKILDQGLKYDESEAIQRVTYETLLKGIDRDSSPLIKSSSGRAEQAVTQLKQYDADAKSFYQARSPYFFSTSSLMDGFTEVTTLKLNTEDGGFPAKKFLGISQEEHNQLLALLTTHNLSKANIYFANLLGDSGSTYLSVAGDKYSIYQLHMIAEDATGALKVYVPDDEVRVYTTDHYAFFSPAYSEPLTAPPVIEVPDFDLTPEEV